MLRVDIEATHDLTSFPAGVFPPEELFDPTDPSQVENTPFFLEDGEYLESPWPIPSEFVRAEQEWRRESTYIMIDAARRVASLKMENYTSISRHIHDLYDNILTLANIGETGRETIIAALEGMFTETHTFLTSIGDTTNVVMEPDGVPVSHIAYIVMLGDARNTLSHLERAFRHVTEGRNAEAIQSLSISQNSRSFILPRQLFFPASGITEGRATPSPIPLPSRTDIEGNITAARAMVDALYKLQHGETVFAPYESKQSRVEEVVSYQLLLVL